MAPDPHLTFETPDRAVVSLRLAGLGGRSLAWLVDALVLVLAWVTLLVAWSFGGDLLRRFQALSSLARAGVALLVLASGWLFDVAFETAWQGRTPGKRLLGLRVVRGDGTPVGLVESLVRNAARAVEVPLLYAPGVLSIALSARHQRLGDLLAGTLVVMDRSRDLSRYAARPATPGAPRSAPHGRVGAVLTHRDFERLADFLRRRPVIEASARARIAGKAARGLAARAGVPPPAQDESEAFLEAVAASAAGGAP